MARLPADVIAEIGDVAGICFGGSRRGHFIDVSDSTVSQGTLLFHLGG